jgi:hypothetical protein
LQLGAIPGQTRARPALVTPAVVFFMVGAPGALELLDLQATEGSSARHTMPTADLGLMVEIAPRWSMQARLEIDQTIFTQD